MLNIYLSVISFASIFSHSLDSLFALSMVSFKAFSIFIKQSSHSGYNFGNSRCNSKIAQISFSCLIISQIEDSFLPWS